MRDAGHYAALLHQRFQTAERQMPQWTDLLRPPNPDGQMQPFGAQAQRGPAAWSSSRALG